jgi:hypothetical protein
VNRGSTLTGLDSSAHDMGSRWAQPQSATFFVLPMTTTSHRSSDLRRVAAVRARPLSDPALHRVRAARRRYWAARAGGVPAEIESALREWVEAQMIAAEEDLDGRDFVDRGESR